MQRIAAHLILGATLALAAIPASAQMSGSIPGTGGAKEQMFPSTVGVDPRPDRETLRAREPTFQAIQARPGWRRDWRHSRWYRRHHRWG